MNGALSCDCTHDDRRVDGDGLCFTCSGALGQPAAPVVTVALVGPDLAPLAQKIREAVLRIRREHPMRDLRSPSGNQFTAAVMEIVGPAIAEIQAAHDRRVSELLEVNNRDVERRRSAEAEADAEASNEPWHMRAIPDPGPTLKARRDAVVEKAMAHSREHASDGWNGTSYEALLEACAVFGAIQGGSHG